MMVSRPAEQFELQAKLFRGLSDHSRLAILETLSDGPLAVGQIVEKSGLTQSNTSNHLKCLSECGLVTSEQKGRFVYYRLSDPQIEKLLRLADAFLAQAGQRIYACTHYDRGDAGQPVETDGTKRLSAKTGREAAGGRKPINARSPAKVAAD
jgi:DNA-binding transcriptional ArsR family regulator